MKDAIVDFLMTLYVVMYFIVSRFWKFRGWMVHAFLLAGLIVCLIGITDYFQMDIFGFRVRIKPSESAILRLRLVILTLTQHLLLWLWVRRPACLLQRRNVWN